MPARMDIHARIAATVPLGTTAGDFAEQALAAQQGIEALKRNLRSEHVLIHNFLSTVFLQARTAAAGHPWLPGAVRAWHQVPVILCLCCVACCRVFSCVERWSADIAGDLDCAWLARWHSVMDTTFMTQGALPHHEKTDSDMRHVSRSC